MTQSTEFMVKSKIIIILHSTESNQTYQFNTMYHITKIILWANKKWKMKTIALWMDTVNLCWFCNWKLYCCVFLFQDIYRNHYKDTRLCEYSWSYYLLCLYYWSIPLYSQVFFVLNQYWAKILTFIAVFMIK